MVRGYSGETYKVLCPDGVDRLETGWTSLRDALFDAKYMTVRGSCCSWGKPGCPGGQHFVPEEREPSMAWTTDLPA